MNEYSVLPGLFVLLVLVPIGMVAWIAMLWLPLRLLGIDLREDLRDISMPEAVLFGLYALGAGTLVGDLFSRFV